ncbi:hypothetical protein, partial [uncultured Helicobacter sp.]|uniref:hypothetical protein n=1 Tax=uncultured Helicobacter sp. TaxID=175537 RepID=UPI002610060C
CRIIEFCDDGFSGTDFRRPGFAGMMEAVKQGEVRGGGGGGGGKNKSISFSVGKCTESFKCAEAKASLERISITQKSLKPFSFSIDKLKAFILSITSLFENK